MEKILPSSDKITEKKDSLKMDNADHPPSSSYTRPNHVSTVMLYDVAIVCLWIDGKERLCLAQISNTLLKDFSYNEIHNRRVALGITCVQCTPVQLEILRRAGAMPVSSRRCGMITKREAERLVKSFLEDIHPPKLPEDFTFDVIHHCGWGCRGDFYPSRYNSSRAKCVKCKYCNMFFSANKFIFHYHRLPDSKYNHPDAANFNSWRRHLILDLPSTSSDSRHEDLLHAWEDVKAMFNGGSRKRMLPSQFKYSSSSSFTAKLQRQSVLERKVQSAPQTTPNTNKSNSVGPLVIEPIIPPFYKPHPQKLSMFSQSGGYSNNPTLIHCQPRPLFGIADVKARQRSSHVGEVLYPSYEMIWAKHLGLPQIPEKLFPVAPQSVTEARFSKLTSQYENTKLSSTMEQSSPNSTDSNNRKTNNASRKSSDIFRPYALDSRTTNDTNDVIKKYKYDNLKRSTPPDLNFLDGARTGFSLQGIEKSKESLVPVASGSKECTIVCEDRQEQILVDEELQDE